MELFREWVTPTTGTKLPSYRVRPARVEAPLPWIVVIQEAFGVDDHIEEVADRFATAGYHAVAPDLFAVGGERPEAFLPARMNAFKRFLDILPVGAFFDESARAKAMGALPIAEQEPLRETLALFAGLNRDSFPAEVAKIVRDLAASGERVGVVGFCLGGGVAAALAVEEPALSAAVVYYGMVPALDKASKLCCPVLAHFADAAKDARITDPGRAFEKAAQSHGQPIACFEYAGAAHAFNNDTRSSYDARAARVSWARTLAFFAEHVGSGE